MNTKLTQDQKDYVLAHVVNEDIRVQFLMWPDKIQWAFFQTLILYT